MPATGKFACSQIKERDSSQLAAHLLFWGQRRQQRLRRENRHPSTPLAWRQRRRWKGPHHDRCLPPATSPAVRWVRPDKKRRQITVLFQRLRLLSSAPLIQSHISCHRKVGCFVTLVDGMIMCGVLLGGARCSGGTVQAACARVQVTCARHAVRQRRARPRT